MFWIENSQNIYIFHWHITIVFEASQNKKSGARAYNRSISTTGACALDGGSSRSSSFLSA
jgi:hypothetical protein